MSIENEKQFLSNKTALSKIQRAHLLLAKECVRKNNFRWQPVRARDFPCLRSRAVSTSSTPMCSHERAIARVCQEPELGLVTTLLCRHELGCAAPHIEVATAQRPTRRRCHLSSSCTASQWRPSCVSGVCGRLKHCHQSDVYASLCFHDRPTSLMHDKACVGPCPAADRNSAL